MKADKFQEDFDRILDDFEKEMKATFKEFHDEIMDVLKDLKAEIHISITHYKI